jgi:uncharacterized protein YgiM (DUF1202 family)
MRRVTIFIAVLVGFVASSNVYAADFKVYPTVGTFGVGKTFSVDLKINTLGESINAAQGKLQFDSKVLQVKSVSKEGSIFNFWLQEPVFSNDTGIVEFIGGTPNGVLGGSLQVISVVFSAKAMGTSDFVFINASITASDGSGTNISGDTVGASFNVSSSGGGALPNVAVVPTPVPEPVPTPVQITRTPALARGLPVKPNIKVQLYPNSDLWYNLVSNFTVSWDLPSDITELNTALNQNPNFDVSRQSEGLFDGKTFPALNQDGIYYLHVRFKNSIGWGPTAHYRIAIDTQPPLPFNIDVLTGLKSDNPSPVLFFQTGDSLSGIESYVISIAGEQPIVLTASQVLNQKTAEDKTLEKVVNRLKVTETGIGYLNVRSGPNSSSSLLGKVYPGDIYEYTEQSGGWYKIKGLPSGVSTGEGWVMGTYVNLISLTNPEQNSNLTALTSSYEMKPHGPGIYMVLVKAVDAAKNSVEARVEIEVLPIKAPEITFITKEIIKGSEDLLVIKGVAIDNGNVIVTITDHKNFLVAQNETNTNENGEWEFRFDQELRNGTYLITATSKDSRGALSYPTDPIEVKYKDKPIIVLLGWEITLKDLIVLLVIIGVGGAMYYWRKVLLHIARSHRETVIITRDIGNAFGLVRQSLSKYANMAEKKKATKEEKTEELKKVKEGLDKVEKYVGKDIEKLD